MSDVSTVHLKGPWAPKGESKHVGYVRIEEARHTVWVYDREDARGKCDTYPFDNVARIEWNTGWGK